MAANGARLAPDWPVVMEQRGLVELFLRWRRTRRIAVLREPLLVSLGRRDGTKMLLDGDSC